MIAVVTAIELREDVDEDLLELREDVEVEQETGGRVDKDSKPVPAVPIAAGLRSKYDCFPDEMVPHASSSSKVVMKDSMSVAEAAALCDDFPECTGFSGFVYNACGYHHLQNSELDACRPRPDGRPALGGGRIDASGNNEGPFHHWLRAGWVRYKTPLAKLQLQTRGAAEGQNATEKFKFDRYMAWKKGR